MLRISFLLVLIAHLTAAYSQNKLTIEGRITDAEDGAPISGVNVFIGNNYDVAATGASTDDKGYYSLTINYEGNERLNFTHTAYANEFLYLTKSITRKAYNDTLRFNQRLTSSAIMGKEVTIFARNKPDTVFGHPEYSVQDFAFYGEDELILLVYEKTLRKGAKLLLTDRQQNIISTYLVPGKAKELYTDFERKVNLVCEGEVFLVAVETQEIVLYPRDKEQFSRQIVPVIDTMDKKVYFSNYNADFPAFDYFTWMEGDSLPKGLTYIIDPDLMELYRSEYKYLPPRQKLEAVRLGMKYKIDKEIAAAILSGFSQSMYYEPLYAPLFVVNDTVVIFDHYDDYLYRFDKNNQPVDSAKIRYHKQTKRIEWRKEMVMDEETHAVYALFLINGFHHLKKINVHTGKVDETFKFTFKYAESIQVRGNYVYYVYRPFESMQKKFLYRERIDAQDISGR